MRCPSCLLIVCLVWPGCGEKGPDPCVDADASIALVDEHNYHYDGALDIQSYPLAELGDPLIDWSGITEDLQGHSFDPVSEVDVAAVVLFGQTSEEEVERGLSNNTLDQSAVTLYVTLEPEGATAANLSEFTVFGNDIDVETYFEVGSGTWLLTLATGTTPGVGTRMAAFLRPDAAETAARLDVANDSTRLDFEVDLRSLMQFPVPAGTPDLTADWSGVIRNGTGNKFVSRDVDQVMLGHYASMTPRQLEDQFLDIELIADALWNLQVEVGATSVDLSGLTGGEEFVGVDDQGTWILALRCSTCANPAPPFLNILHACP